MTDISADNTTVIPPSADVRELIERDLQATNVDVVTVAAPTLLQDIVAVLKKSWVSFAGLFIVAFVVLQFLLSPLLQMHSQVLQTRAFSERLAIAAGAMGQPDLSPLPNSPVAFGTPVAMLQIPSLGVSQVVLEGAGGRQLQQGLGHVAGSAGVSETGVSIIAGRRATWGAPFAALPSVVPATATNPGTAIEITTLAGPMTYHVTKVGASSADAVATPGRSTLVLATSTPSGVAAKDFLVIAVSDKAPYVSTPQNRATGAGLREGDMGALPEAGLWLVVGVLLAAVVTVWHRRRMFPSAVLWAIAAPTLLAVGLLLVRSLDAALPPTL